MKIIKQSLLLVALSLLAYQGNAQQSQLTPKEREDAIRFLKETESMVFNAVKNLSKAQLTYKPAPNKWSVEECVKHIAAAEKELWAMTQTPLKQAPNPEKRVTLKFTDTALIKAVEDRSHKSKTFAALEPANSPYKTIDAALEAFKENREKLIAFVGSTNVDLRDHVLELPVGSYDAYQFILLISAHTNRHVQQLEEVKADPNFPKS
jgi:uncharacterized damage-inducible protein DinB